MSGTTTIDRAKLRSAARVMVWCERDATRIRGNASAIDPQTDRETEEWIEDQLARGNDWAWCVAFVMVEFAGVTEKEVLGGCSYKSEADFRACELDTMATEATERLAKRLEEIADPLVTHGILVTPRKPRKARKKGGEARR